MKYTLALVAALALPAAAQDTVVPEQEPDLSTPLERFADEMRRNFMRDIAPELEGLLDQIGPELQDMFDNIRPELEGLMTDVLPRLMEQIVTLGGLTYYELPEVLPNGDIIIRRKPDAPAIEDLAPQNDPIEL